jgi:drug/metabolite transporter (DMT)-like permease
VSAAEGSNASVHAKLVGMALLWGASWPAGKIAAISMSPLAAGAWRFTVAVAILLVAVQIKLGFPKLSQKQWLALVAGGAIGVFGYAVCFMYGLKLIPASRASLIVTVNPVITTLVAAWLFHERFNKTIALGMALAVLGGIVVISRGNPASIFSGAIGMGELLCFGCVLCWSTYSLIGKAALGGVDPLVSTAYTSAFGLAMLWFATICIEGVPPLPQGVEGVGSIMFLAIGATVLAYLWYFEGIKALGAGPSAAYISLVPVFGVASSILLLNESLSASLIAGGALAVAGLLVMTKGRS